MSSIIFAALPAPVVEVPAILFPDPLAVALDVLRRASVAELELVKYGTEPPDALGDDFPGLPWVAVSLTDVDTSQHPFREAAVLQLTSWADTKAKALRLAQVVRAVLVAYPCDDERVSSITALGRGPIATLDPDTRTPMAWTQVRLRLLPEVLDADFAPR